MNPPPRLRDLWDVPPDAQDDARQLFNSGTGEVADHWRTFHEIKGFGWHVQEPPPADWQGVPLPDGGYLWLHTIQAHPPAIPPIEPKVYFRVRWEGSHQTDDLRPTYSIGGLEHPHDAEQVLMAYTAMALFVEGWSLEEWKAGRGGRPKGRRTGLDDETWLQKTRELRQLTRHDHIPMNGAIARLELYISDRTGRQWIADLDKEEPAC